MYLYIQCTYIYNVRIYTMYVIYNVRIYTYNVRIKESVIDTFIK